jgi:lysozyme
MNAELPDPSLDWPIAWDAVALIARAEGCRLKAYRCIAGVPTCGWGETDGVTMATVWTQEQADARFLDSLTDYTQRVKSLAGDCSDSELAAFVSLAYNIGLSGFARSTVLKAHKAGDRQAAARAFALWNKARVNGVLQPVRGLTARRAAEAALYLRSDDGPMPQAVQAESSLSASPIAQSGGAVVATGAVTIMAQMGEHLGTVGPVLAQARTIIVDALGIPVGWLVPVLLVGIGLAVLHQRWRQRAGGWA